MNLPFCTIGHSTRTIEDFVTLLRTADVSLVVDIRTVRKSRANPQYNFEQLSRSLADYQIACQPLAELGGLRGKSKTVSPDVNGFWQNQSFHNYADYALSDDFRIGLEKLITLGREQRTAIMCSEAVWWRCHRRIVSDHLLARGERVIHLMGPNRMEPARLTAGARIEPTGVVVYPPAEDQSRNLLELNTPSRSSTG